MGVYYLFIVGIKFIYYVLVDQLKLFTKNSFLQSYIITAKLWPNSLNM